MSDKNEVNVEFVNNYLHNYLYDDKIYEVVSNLDENSDNSIQYRVVLSALMEIGYMGREKEENLEEDGLELPSDGSINGKNNKFVQTLEEEIKGLYGSEGSKQGKDWCSIFVDYIYLKAMEDRKKFERLACLNKHRNGGAGVGYSKTYYKFKGHLSKNPEIGAKIFFDNEEGIPSHTGLVCGYDNEYVYTIEGNTSPDTKIVPSGIGVFLKRYRRDDSRVDKYGILDLDEEEKISEKGESLINESVRVIYDRLQIKSREYKDECSVLKPETQEVNKSDLEEKVSFRDFYNMSE